MGRLIFYVNNETIEIIPKKNFILTIKEYFKKFLKDGFHFNEFYAKYISETNEIFKCSIQLERSANLNLSEDEKKNIKRKTGENLNYDRYGLKIERIEKEKHG